jgi:hypothetical protein
MQTPFAYYYSPNTVRYLTFINRPTSHTFAGAGKGLALCQVRRCTMSSSKIEKPSIQSDEGLRSNSMPLSIAVYWLLPMLCIAVMSRMAVDTGSAFLPHQSRPVTANMNKNHDGTGPNVPLTTRESLVSAPVKAGKDMQSTQESGEFTLYLANKPYSYQEVSKLRASG